MGTFSPAFGMVGTLIGLIIMLDNMQGDPTMLGKGLALALITTLYGVLLAQLLFKPAAAKIQQKLEIDRFRNILLTEGFVMLAEKKDTMTIIDRLNSYLSPVARYKLPAATDEEV
jgi:chemotaxis protein MotA